MGRNRKPTKSITTVAEDVLPFNADNVPVFEAKPFAFSNIVATVVRLSPEQQDALIDEQKDNPFVLMAMGMYGGLNQRQRIFEMLKNGEAGFSKTIHGTYSMRGSRATHERITGADLAREYFNRNSLDYLYFKYTNNEDEETGTMRFLNNFWDWWGGSAKHTTRAGWGMLHMYLSQVGPNAEIPPSMDFFPDYPHMQGYVPVLNPKIIRLLQWEYERQQKTLEQAGVPEVVTLYRGTHQPRGLPLESFSTEKKIAKQFAEGEVEYSGSRNGKGEVRKEQVPRKYIFGSWKTIRNWVDPYKEREFMVLGTSFYNNERQIQRQTRASARGIQQKFTDFNQNYQWNPDTEQWTER